MKLLLTSFGVSHLPQQNEVNPAPFYRMPPVSMAQVHEAFLPDYAVLLLTDEVILDKNTYDRLMSGWHSPSYANVAVMIRVLYDEGFIRIEDFDAVIQANRDMLDQILQRDLKELELWIEPLKTAVTTWRQFTELLDRSLRHEIFAARLEKNNLTSEYTEQLWQYQMHMAQSFHHVVSCVPYRVRESLRLVDEALHSSRKRRKAKYHKALKEHLTECLSYVNANLLLSQTLEAGFHDWYDFQPFYREKFLRVAKDAPPGEKEIENVKKLFEISFPEFTFWHPDNVIRALKDDRIRDLRVLVDQACKGEVEFDREFANRTLQEVLKMETGIGTFRNMVSYATAPLGFIPVVGTPVQKAVEESATRLVERKKRKKFRWFYMISELATKARAELGQQTDGGDA